MAEPRAKFLWDEVGTIRHAPVMKASEPQLMKIVQLLVGDMHRSLRRSAFRDIVQEFPTKMKSLRKSIVKGLSDLLWVALERFAASPSLKIGAEG
jgi:hypothetical protein